MSAACIAAQNRSINFNVNGDWKQIVKEARKSKKLIFIDCYTTWCGPCKLLDKNIFTRDTVADFYNATFVNTKFDMEKGTGIELAKKYAVRAFPTLLYIDPATEEIVHRIVGAGDVDFVVSNGKLALDPKNNLAGLVDRYESGEKNVEVLKEYLDALGASGSRVQQSNVTINYLSKLTNDELVEKDNWEMLSKNVRDIFSEPIQRVLSNKAFFEKAVGKEAVNNKISALLKVGVTEFQSRRIEPNPDFDKERFDRFLNLVTTIDNESAPGCAVQLHATLNAQNEDYPALLNNMEDALKYNLIQDRSKSNFLMINLAKLSKATDQKDRERTIAFIDRFLSQTTDSFTHSSFYQIKGHLLKTYGDEEGSLQAFEAAKASAREGETKTGGRAMKAIQTN
jgi:thiol-disulfide isomerase/thioredoxin